MKTLTAQLAEITAQADAATGTPSQIDAVLAQTYSLNNALLNHRDSITDRVHRALGHKADTRRGFTTWYAGRELVIDTDAITAARTAGPGRVADALAAYDRAVAALAEVDAAEAPFQARYETERWNRYFWVAKGHGHRTMSCSTCNNGASRTEFNWHPELSGLTDADAIATFGTGVCTVCFPDAPVAPKLTPAAARAARTEAAAAKAAEVKAAKAADPALITDVDGSELRIDHSTIKTVRTAEIKGVDELWWAAFGLLIGEPNPRNAAEHEATADKIFAALAHKAGVPAAQVRATAAVKAVKKIRKDFGAEVAQAAATLWGV